MTPSQFSSHVFSPRLGQLRLLPLKRGYLWLYVVVFYFAAMRVQAEVVVQDALVDALCGANGGVSNETSLQWTSLSFANGTAVVTIATDRYARNLERCMSFCSCGANFYGIESGTASRVSPIIKELVELEMLPVELAMEGIVAGAGGSSEIIIVVTQGDEQTDYRFQNLSQIGYDASSGELSFLYESLFTETSRLDPINGGGERRKRRRQQRRRLVGDTPTLICYTPYRCPVRFRS